MQNAAKAEAFDHGSSSDRIQRASAANPVVRQESFDTQLWKLDYRVFLDSIDIDFTNIYLWSIHGRKVVYC